MKIMKLMLLAGLLAGCSSVPVNGRDTRDWLSLQKNGAAASTETPQMVGEAADKAYKRYVDSFGHPLPETYSRESFAGSQGSGGSQK